MRGDKYKTLKLITQEKVEEKRGRKVPGHTR